MQRSRVESLGGPCRWERVSTRQVPLRIPASQEMPSLGTAELRRIFKLPYTEISW
jgi:hypothetical protein